MENNDLRPADKVAVICYDTNGKEIFRFEGKGFRNLDDAVTTAVNADLPTAADPRDYPYRVENIDKNTAENNRINAHGHLHLEV